MGFEESSCGLPAAIVAERERSLAGRNLASASAAGLHQRGEGKLMRVVRPSGNLGEFDRPEIDRLDVPARPGPTSLLGWWQLCDFRAIGDHNRQVCAIWEE